MNCLNQAKLMWYYCPMCNSFTGQPDNHKLCGLEDPDTKSKKPWEPSNELLATMAASLMSSNVVTQVELSVEVARKICRLIGEE